MPIENLILEYLKVFISWPVVVLIIMAFLSVNFRPEIANWLRNLAIKRGDIEVYSKQIPSLDEPAEEFLPSAEIVDKELLELDRKIDGMINAIGPLSTKEVDEVPAKTIERLRQTLADQVGIITLVERQSLYWEFQYLNYFLVENSKKVLAWFSTYTVPIPVMTFHAAWTPYIFSAADRTSILTALTNQGLLQIKNNMVSITAKGKEYINWAGLSALLKN